MWTKPEVPEGEELLDYSLWYSLSNRTSGSGKEDLLVIKAEDTQAILRGLVADSTYYVRLAGRSSNGHGTTATLEFRTKEHRKSAYRLQHPLSPVDLNVFVPYQRQIISFTGKVVSSSGVFMIPEYR